MQTLAAVPEKAAVKGLLLPACTADAPRTETGPDPVAVCWTGDAATSVGPAWAWDALEALEDGAATTAPDGRRLERVGESPWVGVDVASAGRVAKRTLVDAAGPRRWLTPKFDATLAFSVDDREYPAAVMEALDANVDPVLWAVLYGMHEGEVVQVRVTDADTDTRFVVKLARFANPLERWQVAQAAERARLCDEMRVAATNAVRAASVVGERAWGWAAKKYERALGFADDDATRAALELNLAAVAAHARDWSAVTSRCTRVLSRFDPKSARARLRRGIAFLELGKLDDAKEDLRRVPDESPDFSAAQAALRRLARRADKDDSALKPMCRAMLRAVG